jgi:hypothetical protein
VAGEEPLEPIGANVFFSNWVGLWSLLGLDFYSLFKQINEFPEKHPTRCATNPRQTETFLSSCPSESFRVPERHAHDVCRFKSGACCTPFHAPHALRG